MQHSLPCKSWNRILLVSRKKKKYLCTYDLINGRVRNAFDAGKWEFFGHQMALANHRAQKTLYFQGPTPSH
jgi:hypothetical protein